VQNKLYDASKYVGSAKLVMYYNNQHLNLEHDDDEIIEKQSQIKEIQFKGG
jgi:hypothetical protein